MKNKRVSWIRSFIVFGGFVFLITLFVNGKFTAARTGRFFTTADEIPSHLPFSIFAGVICGLIFVFFESRKP